MRSSSDPSQPQVLKWIEVGDEANGEQVRPLADKLRAAGFDAAVMIRRGNPTKKILDEAESWGANCIFLVRRGRAELTAYFSAASPRRWLRERTVQLRW